MSTKIDSKLLGWNDALIGHCTMHVLNNQELLIVPHTRRAHSLWKFNLDSKQFSEWHKYPTTDNNIIFEFSSSALNDEKTKLYIFGHPGFVVIVDLNDGTFTASNKQYHDGAHCKTIYANGQFHIFGGWHRENKSHSTWNDEMKELREMHKFDEMVDVDALNRSALVYSKSTNTVYFMDWYSTKSVYSYDLKTHKCIKTEIVRDQLEIYETVMTNDDQYIIAFSFYKIHVIDMGKMKFLNKTLDITGDDLTVGRACIKNNDVIAGIVTIGYVHQYSKQFPKDIIGVISKYIAMETIFMINNGRVWSVEVNDIIRLCTTDDC